MITACYNVYETFMQSLLYSRLLVNVGFESKACVIRPKNDPNMVQYHLKCVELKPGF